MSFSGTGKRKSKVDALTLEVITPYLHTHPLKKAADELKVCENTLRKAARREGYERWPYVQPRLRTCNFHRFTEGCGGGSGGGEPASNFIYVDEGIVNPGSGGVAVGAVSNLINVDEGGYFNPATAGDGGGGGGGGLTMSNLISDITFEQYNDPFSTDQFIDAGDYAEFDTLDESFGSFGDFEMYFDD